MEPKTEQVGTKEVIIPQETARALGRGLRQLLDQPLQELNPYINNLKNAPGVDQDYVQAMETSIKKTRDLSTKLEKAKEVKIVPLSAGPDFAFSEERETEEQSPIQSEIIIDDTTTPRLNQLTLAIQHNFNNILNPLMGFSEDIQLSAQDATTRQNAEEILSRSESIFNAIKPIQNADYQLRISTGSNGTTITPVQPALVNQKI